MDDASSKKDINSYMLFYFRMELKEKKCANPRCFSKQAAYLRGDEFYCRKCALRIDGREVEEEEKPPLEDNEKEDE